MTCLIFLLSFRLVEADIAFGGEILLVVVFFFLLDDDDDARFLDDEAERLRLEAENARLRLEAEAERLRLEADDDVRRRLRIDARRFFFLRVFPFLRVFFLRLPYLAVNRSNTVKSLRVLSSSCSDAGTNDADDDRLRLLLLLFRLLLRLLLLLLCRLGTIDHGSLLLG